jgi:ribonucleoside-diphosphate reductase subunit M2
VDTEEGIFKLKFFDLQLPEAQLFADFEESMGYIHLKMLRSLVLEYIPKHWKRTTLKDEYESISVWKENWGSWFNRPTKSFGERLISFMAAKRIFFSTSFAVNFLLKKRRLMPGLTRSLELILRDRSLFCDFSGLLFSYIENRTSKEIVLQIITEAVIIEQELVTLTLPVSLIGLNCDQMSNYIEFEADQLLQQLGFDPHYNKLNPFKYLEEETDLCDEKVDEYDSAVYCR